MFIQFHFSFESIRKIHCNEYTCICWLSVKLNRKGVFTRDVPFIPYLRVQSSFFLLSVAFMARNNWVLFLGEQKMVIRSCCCSCKWICLDAFSMSIQSVYMLNVSVFNAVYIQYAMWIIMKSLNAMYGTQETHTHNSKLSKNR